MTRRWMTVVMVLLALAMLGTTGCIKKKKRGPAIDPNAGLVGDQVIVGYDEFGNPIYGSALDAGLVRTDDPVIAAGQFEAVYFEYDSPQLNPSEQGKISAVVAYLQSNPTHGVIIEGHCDERGSNEYNVALGERRALAVRAAMIAAGIDSARVQTRSYGEERPVAFGHDESAWRLNRRAEFVFTQM
ncbi:MAG TPA: OmpA family protein [Kiritimatiellia bacterium]|jgi:peptidoglycan-associated lipoprotein|nr:OmpA family protein [Kiritimatiellia bacterium]HQQ60691.1 OmpA family protein [Kiritimatiellia bacterium]